METRSSVSVSWMLEMDIFKQSQFFVGPLFLKQMFNLTIPSLLHCAIMELAIFTTNKLDVWLVNQCCMNILLGEVSPLTYPLTEGWEFTLVSGAWPIPVQKTSFHPYVGLRRARQL